LDIAHFLIRPSYLLVFGYTIAYWGGAEIRLKRQLELLREINTLSNPRFGVGHIIILLMKRVRAFFDADACLVLLCNHVKGKYRLSKVDRNNAHKTVKAEPIAKDIAQKLLAMPDNLAVIYNAKRSIWHFRGSAYHAYDVVKERTTRNGLEESRALSVILEAESFLSIPFIYKGKMSGRLYLTGGKGLFSASVIDFLLQLIQQVARVLDSVRILDWLASTAAEQERQRIARDLHDSVIQPYIGIQYKVAAIRNKLAIGNNIAPDMDKLFNMTINEITGLRHFVRGLKDAQSGPEDLLSAIRRYIAQFEENYGITVEIECKSDVMISDRLAAELIQMIHEGLSNIRKHTDATSVSISLERVDNNILLTIMNEVAVGESNLVAPFTPRSISERAEGLGGHVEVEPGQEGRSTIVKVTIPL
jgi:signal transduction histidine kinase